MVMELSFRDIRIVLFNVKIPFDVFKLATDTLPRTCVVRNEFPVVNGDTDGLTVGFIEMIVVGFIEMIAVGFMEVAVVGFIEMIVVGTLDGYVYKGFFVGYLDIGFFVGYL